jgi:cytoskeletal protein RodZ
MTWSGLLKFLLGFLLAIALLAAGGYLVAQHVIAQLTAPPPKPTFPNDNPNQAKSSQVASPKPTPTAKSSPQPSPTPSAKPSPKETGYLARITLANGLNLRDEPSRDGARVGGVAFNERVMVLEETPDKEWQRVRLESSNQEGWIRSGYTERVN